MGDTRTDLVEAIKKAGPLSLARATIVEWARLGRYRCFKSDLAAPKVRLVADLRAAGLHDLARRAIDGEWDEESDAVDQAELVAEFGADTMDAVRKATSPAEVLAIAQGANRADRRAARKRRGN